MKLQLFLLTVLSMSIQSAEVGFIKYETYPDYYQKARFNQAVKALTDAGFNPVIIPEDTDIFLPRNAEKIKQYKRIWIPSYAHAFTPAMYQGMEQYVRGGGLLISCSLLQSIDANADYKFEARTDASYSYRNVNPLTGSQSHWAQPYSALKITVPSPLTTGIELPEYREMPDLPVGRVARKVTTMQVMIAGRTVAKDGPAEGYLLACNSLGKGAVILYSGSAGGLSNQIVKNILSQDTLEWLCEQQ